MGVRILLKKVAALQGRVAELEALLQGGEASLVRKLDLEEIQGEDDPEILLRLYTLGEVAELTSVSPSTLLRYARDGSLRAVYLGSKRYFRFLDIKDWIDALPETPYGIAPEELVRNRRTKHN